MRTTTRHRKSWSVRNHKLAPDKVNIHWLTNSIELQVHKPTTFGCESPLNHSHSLDPGIFLSSKSAQFWIVSQCWSHTFSVGDSATAASTEGLWVLKSSQFLRCFCTQVHIHKDKLFRGETLSHLQWGMGHSEGAFIIAMTWWLDLNPNCFNCFHDSIDAMFQVFHFIMDLSQVAAPSPRFPITRVLSGHWHSQFLRRLSVSRTTTD